MMEHYIAIILVAIGTYLARFLPIYFNERFKRLKCVDEFLTYSSTALISALFITSLVSFPVKFERLFVRYCSFNSGVCILQKMEKLRIFRINRSDGSCIIVFNN